MSKKSVFEAAQASLKSASGLTAGLTKIATSELIKKYPKGVTLTGFDIISWQDKSFPLCTFAEEPDSCFGGGVVLQQMIEGILEVFEGDIDAANTDIRENPFKVRPFWTKSKAGRRYIGMEVYRTVSQATKKVATDEEKAQAAEFYEEQATKEEFT